MSSIIVIIIKNAIRSDRENKNLFFNSQGSIL
jgi:hypothetical protein